MKLKKHDPQTHSEFKGGTCTCGKGPVCPDCFLCFNCGRMNFELAWETEAATKEELIAFEEEIKNLFLDAKIRAPVHLSRGNEEPLIEIFKEVRPEDWCFSTHRSHYHALLKGIDPEWLKREILEGRSIHVYNREHNFFSSAIVGGCLPIALGVAISIKRKGEKGHVWVFTGDMGAETGIFHECTKYARRNDLPITFVIEDNQLSINSPTQELWGKSKSKGNITRYKYNRGVPHVGVGTFVPF